MSEYQYYEFAAVERPLGDSELAAVRAVSSRAHLTPTSFTNSYEWGDFRGDPQQLMERYYDGFLYLTNWGTRRLMLRFPAHLLDLDTAHRYCAGYAVSAWRFDGSVIVEATSEDEDGDDDWDVEGVLGSILPVRAEVLAGDLRALYVLWLLGVQTGEVDADTDEPPVPQGLAELTAPQAALAGFLRLDRDLLDVAAVRSAPSGPGQGDVDVESWVRGLGPDERDALLVGLLRDTDPFLRAETMRRIRPAPAQRAGERTAGQLVEAAATQRAERERAAREQAERDTAERARLAAEARREHLASLAAQGESAWDRVATRIAEKKPAAYDVAVDLLADLREVTAAAEFARRIQQLRDEHSRKPGLIGRLAAAGL